ncbi:MAG TPA: DUF167 domain-containing protein [Candidatus Manganitrophaceae bacterium]
MWDLRPYKSGSLLHVRVKPNASRNEVESCAEGILRLKLTAAPVEGAANEALLKYLSSLLDIPKTRMEIVKGAHAKDKRVWIKDLQPAALARRLEEIAAAEQDGGEA